MRSRHSKRGFMLLIVIFLFSLAVVAELLATRHLVNLRHHVRQRQQLIQDRNTASKIPFEKIPPLW